MMALRELITSALGADATVLSLLHAAAERGFDGSVSVREFSAAVDSSDTGDFTLLDAPTDGTGRWRADRFRIYFSGPGMDVMPSATHVSEFGRLFPQIFNGVGSEVGALDLIPNIATTFYRFDHPVNAEPTLQFTFDARVLFQFIDVPDAHDDWVGFMQQDAGGFCVQTLKRNFVQAADAGMGLAAAEAVALVTPAAPFIANPLTGLVAGITAGAINRYHFLAGRRAWRIGLLPPVFGPLLPDKPAHIYYLETAAIDRFSTWVVRLAAATGKVGLGDFPALVAQAWTTQLTNWVRYGGSTFAYDADLSAWAAEIAAVAGAPFAQGNGLVVFDQGEFESVDDMLDEPWVQALLVEHSALQAALP